MCFSRALIDLFNNLRPPPSIIYYQSNPRFLVWKCWLFPFFKKINTNATFPPPPLLILLGDSAPIRSIILTASTLLHRLVSYIECLLYLPKVGRAIQYKLGPQRLTRLEYSNVLRLPVTLASQLICSDLLILQTNRNWKNWCYLLDFV